MLFVGIICLNNKALKRLFYHTCCFILKHVKLKNTEATNNKSMFQENRRSLTNIKHRQVIVL